MATIDDFLGWVREDLGETDVSDFLNAEQEIVWSEASLPLGGGQYRVRAYTERPGAEAKLEALFVRKSFDERLHEGPLRYTIWTKCLAAIVKNEAERMATQDARESQAAKACPTCGALRGSPHAADCSLGYFQGARTG